MAKTDILTIYILGSIVFGFAYYLVLRYQYREEIRKRGKIERYGMEMAILMWMMVVVFWWFLLPIYAVAWAWCAVKSAVWDA